MICKSPEHYMRHALLLAKKGIGYVSPNPPVGAVLVKNGEIIGEGYHIQYGGNHAEKNAILDAKKRGHSPKGSDIYVTLEPCSHYGKTPPCAELLVKEGIQRVFFAISDPNSESTGGQHILQNANIETHTGICETEAQDLIRVFTHCQKSDFPLVVGKIALSKEGAFTKKEGTQTQITGKKAEEWTHQMRHEHDALLIGCETVLVDDPLLSVRYGDNARDPIRILLDPHGRISQEAQVFRDENFLHVTSKKPIFGKKNTLYIPSPLFQNFDLSYILQKCFALGIRSILVEGGKKTLEGFLNAHLVDEMYLLRSPVSLGSSGTVFDFGKYKDEFDPVGEQKYGDDVIQKWGKKRK